MSKKPGRPRIEVPWNEEKPRPGPVPGPVKIEVPWDEAGARLPIPPLLKPRRSPRKGHDG
jgi:hypothetical protein